MCAERVLNLFDVLLAEERSLIPEEAVQSLTRERQEGGEEHLERVDGFERGENRQRGGFFVLFDGCPRRVDVEIDVHNSGEFHRFTDGGTQAHGFEFHAHSVEYFEIVDDIQLIPVKTKKEFTKGRHYFGCIAVKAGKIRLIDNIEFRLV